MGAFLGAEPVLSCAVNGLDAVKWRTVVNILTEWTGLYFGRIPVK